MRELLRQNKHGDTDISPTITVDIFAASIQGGPKK